MLNVDRLSKMYGNGPQAGVREASFTLGSAAFFTLLGPSGCGTTTWFAGAMEGTQRDGLCDVRLQGGATLVCAGDGGTAHEARVPLRLERMTLRPPGEPAPPDTNRLQGRIVFAGSLGAMDRYQVDVVRLSCRPMPVPGRPMRWARRWRWTSRSPTPSCSRPVGVGR